MQASEFVLPVHQWIEHREVIEAAGGINVFPIAGDGVNIRHRLVHATMFGAEHVLHLGVAET